MPCRARKYRNIVKFLEQKVNYAVVAGDERNAEFYKHRLADVLFYGKVE